MGVLHDVFHGLRSIRDADWYCTGRLKNTSTILDKLRRTKTRLAQMQDIAGLRVVLKNNAYLDQDAWVPRIVVAAGLDSSRVIDIRDKPHSGYRAVHVVGKRDGYNVELQVRTHLQHLWAQVYERIADAWGRGIRYGHPPTDPGATMEITGGRVSREEIISYMQELSTQIHEAGASQEREARDVVMALKDVLRAFPGRREHAAPESALPQDGVVLLAYDRGKGEVVERVAAGAEILMQRWMELDLQHRNNANMEIVLLTAHSELVLEHTHARYFAPPEELAGEESSID
jgi:ppGpp synthetase/RelA/SpoT-type nucleotidyltranferase